MSRLEFSHLLLPQESDPMETWVSDLYSPALKLGLVQKITQTPEKLIPPEQKKMLRSVSREAVFLMAVCNPLKDQLSGSIQKDPFSIGIYCALESVPVDYSFAKILARNPENNWPQIFASDFPPKDTLKVNLGLVPAALSIFLGAMGPSTTFYNQEYGLLHALMQAEQDLMTGMVQSAVVCTAHTATDVLMVLKNRARLPSEVPLKEGAAVVLLENNNEWTDWEKALNQTDLDYGISSPLIHYLKERTSCEPVRN